MFLIFYIVCRHAKRTVVAPEDIRLCCRRNDDLLGHVTEVMERLRREREARRAPVAHGNGEGEAEPTVRNKKTSKKRKLTIDNDKGE